MKLKSYDVLIVGGGLAGLSAADRLEQLNRLRVERGEPALTYAVVEGAESLGGRTRTKYPEYGHLDLGGQYLSPKEVDPNVGGNQQSAAWGLVDRFRIETFQTYLPADKPNIYQDSQGNRLLFQGNYPNAEDASVRALVAKVEEAVSAMRHYVGRPWLFPNAAELDALSVADWMSLNVEDAAMAELFAIAIRSAFSVEPAQCSLLHFLHYSASCGSFAAFENVINGGDAVRFRFGTADLVNRLADAVGRDRIFTSRRVVSITQDSGGCQVVVRAAEGEETWAARKVIMAMSPSASAERIRYVPGLPAAREQLTAGMPMAHTIKGYAIFKTPWWREAFSGYVLSAAGPAGWVMDNTWEENASGKLGTPSLMTFIVGDRAIQWSNANSTPEARQAAVLEQLQALFQDGRVQREFVRYVDFDWGVDEWGRGCPAGCLAKGVLTRTLGDQRVGEALYAAVGHIHWAGSETGLVWMGGYMNGAIDSGVRAAAEVAVALTP